ncbi:MAG: SIMPL domain-containing protein [Epsilonproteobacteria bacterium]|nr:SIMPL domain-containing protein [Campylobacterota bacterium]
MDKKSGFFTALAGLFVGLGLVIAGFFVYRAAEVFKERDRVLSVKGLAERRVKADIAIFPVTIEVSDNDFKVLNQKLKNSLDISLKFLKNYGFSKDEISFSPPQIVDKLANAYNSSVKIRYTADVTLTIYTDKIDKILSLQKDLFKLSEEGVLARVEKYDIQYLFTNLNKIKPSMIEEATKNAKKAALKFAKDSKSVLGKVKRASQGYFSINDRDKNTPYIKVVRVVTRMDYYLGD